VAIPHYCKALCYNGGKSAAVSAAHLLHRRNFRHLKKCLIHGNLAVTPRDNCCDSGTSAVILGTITAAAESPTLQQLTNYPFLGCSKKLLKIT